MKDSTLDLFTEILDDEKWLSIDELVKKVRTNTELKNRLLEDVEDKALKTACRQLVKRVKDENGMPRFASIVQTDESGNEKRVYKQETLFDVNDYLQVTNYHSTQVIHHAKMVRHYSAEYKTLTGKQLMLPYDDKSILLD